MELKEGTSVFSVDGEEIGKINRFVLNPVSKKVTHIVVQKGLIFPEDKVIPIDWVTATHEDRVSLSRASTEIQDLPPFEEVHYVQLDEEEGRRLAYAPYTYAPSYYWYPPYGTTSFGYSYYPPEVTVETERNIPEKTIPLQEGADVISADSEHVGDVERVFIDPTSNRATHILISQGLLLKERKLVPLDWVSTMMENEVHLAVGSKFIDRLPDYQE